MDERKILFNHVYGQVVRRSLEHGRLCLGLIKAKFFCFCTCYYVALIVVISLLFTWFNVGYKHGYVIGYGHGYFMYLLVTKRIMDARPN